MRGRQIVPFQDECSIAIQEDDTPFPPTRGRTFTLFTLRRTHRRLTT